MDKLYLLDVAVKNGNSYHEYYYSDDTNDKADMVNSVTGEKYFAFKGYPEEYLGAIEDIGCREIFKCLIEDVFHKTEVKDIFPITKLVSIDESENMFTLYFRPLYGFNRVHFYNLLSMTGSDPIFHKMFLENIFKDDLDNIFENYIYAIGIDYLLDDNPYPMGLIPKMKYYFHNYDENIKTDLGMICDSNVEQVKKDFDIKADNYLISIVFNRYSNIDKYAYYYREGDGCNEFIARRYQEIGRNNELVAQENER